MMINKRDRFENIKTKNKYVVISLTKIKIGEEWFKGVIYTSEDIDYGELETRELEDFKIKFEKIY